MDKKELLETINNWAKEAVQKYGELEKQKEYAKKKVFENRDIIEMIVDEYLNVILIPSLNNESIYEARYAWKKELNNYCADQNRRYPMVECLLESFFCGSKPIGDCLGEEVKQQGNWHINIGKGNIMRGRIFLEVAKKVPDKEYVSEHITGEDLKKIIRPKRIC